MTASIEILVCKRFMTLYGEPPGHSLPALLAEYRKALDGTEASLLTEAVDHVVKQHGYRNWPTVGECVAAVRVVAERRAAAKLRTRNYQPEAPRQEPTPEARARVDALMKATIAKLKVGGPAPAKSAPMPDVSRHAWEARFGKPPPLPELP